MGVSVAVVVGGDGAIASLPNGAGGGHVAIGDWLRRSAAGVAAGDGDGGGGGEDDSRWRCN